MFEYVRWTAVKNKESGYWHLACITYFPTLTECKMHMDVMPQKMTFKEAKRSAAKYNGR